ncbi:lysophospholipid acyltransferase family protein [Marinifilum flexuosum]|uniref:lysophospholipid acyltransferase family protein n=1 Tax=Marinifilum flexuosum TaxID=1117708 RepID=UPI00249590DA|nr:lysophospholipid acyltransferase family protein [Marinifilum flexuosum]
MTPLLYYLFLKPISLLPLRFSYLISDLLFVLNHYVIRYRKNLILNNIRNSFPEKSDKEHKKIARDFNRFFCDFIVESIRCFSMSNKEALKRCKAINPEVLDELHKKKKSIVLAFGHYNNWEMVAMALGSSLKHKTSAIYKPLSNNFFDKKFRETRGKSSLQLVPKRETKTFLEEKKDKAYLVGFGCDQCPKRNKTNLFWTKFLNQDTAVMFGTEKYAVDYDYAVVFLYITRRKRGYYDVELKIIEENPRESKYGSITKQHTKLLEDQIKQNPQYWLWSHKRWKLQKQDHEICH